MASFTKKDILYLFYRPLEPSFIPKGRNRVRFDVPVQYLPKELADNASKVLNLPVQYALKTVPVKLLSDLPPLDEISEIKLNQSFSTFNQKHNRIAAKIISYLLGAKNLEDLISLAVYFRENINPHLFSYSLSVALLHRSDTSDLNLPSPVHYFPDHYFHSEEISEARKHSFIFGDNGDLKGPLVIKQDYTATDLEIEHRLWYFREDIGVNLHHWQWHISYPLVGEPAKKDRTGELFYYMHQQIMARYNFERLSNRMRRVEPLVNWDRPIKEGYFPKMNILNSSKSWPARASNQVLQNVFRGPEGTYVDIDDLRKWKQRIMDAIDAGKIEDENGKDIDLDEVKGIDILGNLIQANYELSINFRYYGDLHNTGHDTISAVHDPDQRNLEPLSVMSTTQTAMRDPAFYRWHSFINSLFVQHKSNLPPYPTTVLDYPDIEVTEVTVKSQGPDVTPNVLHTFWQQGDVDIAGGLDFANIRKLWVRFSHLHHLPFTYNITVNNDSTVPKKGTCRIFLAPKYDERRMEFIFHEQRHLFIEMDKFACDHTRSRGFHCKILYRDNVNRLYRVPHTYVKPGLNVINRDSSESSVTIPLNQVYREIDERELVHPVNAFCGCGWPENLLVPKGEYKGKPCQLFVMVSNYDEDKVSSTTPVTNDNKECKDAYSYCGTKNQLYPDKRAMGYPFDREVREEVNYLSKFLTTNMKVADVTIKFTDKSPIPEPPKVFGTYQ